VLYSERRGAPSNCCSWARREERRSAAWKEKKTSVASGAEVAARSSLVFSSPF